MVFCSLGPSAAVVWLDRHPLLWSLGVRNGFFEFLPLWSIFGTTLFFVASLFAATAFRCHPMRLGFLRSAIWVCYGWGLVYTAAVFHWTGIPARAGSPAGEAEFTNVALFFWRYDLLWPVWAGAVLLALVHVVTWQRMTQGAYGILISEPEGVGDRILENLRSGGEEPVYRANLVRSVLLHFFVLLLLPWLLQLGGCVRDYEVPHGSGDPVVALVQMVQPKKKKKQRLVLNPNSAIYFHVPDLEDSEILEQVVEATEQTYQADPNAAFGRMGAGGGKAGGWPDGMADGVVRFIRLEYSGERWDDGMDSRDNAEMNFLREFHRLTGFNVADTPESHPVRLLRKYSPGKAPPFVYMTGSGSINIPPGDVSVLRDYIEEGGMLFADAGSPAWDRNFRNFARALFPNDPLRVIAADDPLFQYPYAFPNGAPPLWHHGGMQAMGIKRGGRWVVFYHPGDMKDAWKTGHSGLSPELAVGAFQMGTNIIYYSFTNYLERTRSQRK